MPKKNNLPRPQTALRLCNLGHPRSLSLRCSGIWGLLGRGGRAQPNPSFLAFDNAKLPPILKRTTVDQIFLKLLRLVFFFAHMLGPGSKINTIDTTHPISGLGRTFFSQKNWLCGDYSNLLYAECFFNNFQVFIIAHSLTALGVSGRSSKHFPSFP